MRIRTKLTLLLIGLSLLVILAAGTFSILTFDSYFRSRILDELNTQSREIEFVLRNSAVSDSAAIVDAQNLANAANLKLTLIDVKGNVILESGRSGATIEEMDNQLQQPEIEAAEQASTGTDVRRSLTLGMDMVYQARKITSPLRTSGALSLISFLRVATPITQLTDVQSAVRLRIILTSLVILLLVAIASLFIARRSSSPIIEMAAIAEEIRAGDLSKRLPIHSQDEVGMLGATLNGLIGQLNEEIVKLRKMERVRTEFLGNVSHELRTPIFAIQGLLETLIDGAVDDTTVNRSFLTKALANASRLNSLLEDLIEISRIESGEMRMSFRFFGVNEFLESVVEDIVPPEHENVTVRLEMETDSSVHVYGDRERLRQVMDNLIENAVRYNKNGGGVVIGSRLMDDRVEISVADTGIGIASEHLPRIFERFYRIDKDRSREVGGTGLGLAIVKHIVEAHRSRVEVESAVGKGSVFRFALRRG